MRPRLRRSRTLVRPTDWARLRFEIVKYADAHALTDEELEYLRMYVLGKR